MVAIGQDHGIVGGLVEQGDPVQDGERAHLEQHLADLDRLEVGSRLLGEAVAQRGQLVRERGHDGRIGSRLLQGVQGGSHRSGEGPGVVEPRTRLTALPVEFDMHGQ